ncbi:hypothetical protein [Daejeonella lutea]|uniref:Uncharacterized protein n=1 Tax=Daejeonella lutea TaxID=572036 RepID=A0A1T5A553_9SPHI|nr:hypothetical protein [Daejeonella lutea]SKB29763.1 hypothetical protein SAMN05661099_0303 [Daejeonella lutea]
METHKNISHKGQTTFTYQTKENYSSIGIWEKYNAFVDTQKPNAIGWWLGSLMLHGCILVPISFLLVYSLGGPTIPFLFISMSLFFINVIANMGGAAFKVTFNSFMLSIAIHILMALTVILNTL